MTGKTNSAFRLAAALAACMFVAHVSAAPAPAAATQAGGLKVTVKYTGKGDVDKSHRIWVWAFDTPDISPGSIPIGEMSIDKNGGDVMFSGLSAGKVYLAVAFDIAGGFMGSAPPPSGSPVVIHSDAKGAPVAVATGDKAAVTVALTDAQKMP